MAEIDNTNPKDQPERVGDQAKAEGRTEPPSVIDLMKGGTPVEPATRPVTAADLSGIKPAEIVSLGTSASGYPDESRASRLIGSVRERVGNVVDRVMGPAYPTMSAADVAAIGKAYIDQAPDELEKGPRQSIVAGLKWMAENPDARPRWTTWSTMDRSVSPANEAARQVEAVMDQAYDGHSGASFGWSVRKMLEIRKGGSEQFADAVNLERLENAPPLDKTRLDDFARKYIASAPEMEGGIRESVVAGLKWMADNPQAKPLWSQSGTADRSMFEKNDAAKQVEAAMSKAYDGHSGASFGFAVRQMMAIRMAGLDKASEQLKLADVPLTKPSRDIQQAGDTGSKYPAMSPKDVDAIGKDYIAQGGSERGIRQSIVAGLKWMAENPNEKPEWKSWGTAEGSVSPANEAARKVEAVMDQAYDGHSGGSFGFAVRKMLEFRNGGTEKFAAAVKPESELRAKAEASARDKTEIAEKQATVDKLMKDLPEAVKGDDRAVVKWISDFAGPADRVGVRYDSAAVLAGLKDYAAKAGYDLNQEPDFSGRENAPRTYAEKVVRSAIASLSSDYNMMYPGLEGTYAKYEQMADPNFERNVERMNAIVKSLPDAIKAGPEQTVDWLSKFSQEASWGLRTGVEFDRNFVVKQLEAAGFSADEPLNAGLANKDANAFVRNMAADVLYAAKYREPVKPVYDGVADYKVLAEGGQIVKFTMPGRRNDSEVKVWLDGKPGADVKGTLAPGAWNNLDQASMMAAAAAKKIDGAVKFDFNGEEVIAKPGQTGADVSKPLTDRWERERQAWISSPEYKAQQEAAEARRVESAQKFAEFRDLIQSGKDLPFTTPDRDALAAAVEKARSGKLSNFYGADIDTKMINEVVQINTKLQSMADAAKAGTGPVLTPELMEKAMGEIAPDHSGASWGLMSRLVIATAREDVGRALFASRAENPEEYKQFVESFAKSMKPEVIPTKINSAVVDKSVDASQKLTEFRDLIQGGKDLPFTTPDREALATAVERARTGKLSNFYGAALDTRMMNEVVEINTKLQVMADAAKSGTGPALTPELIEQTMGQIAPDHSGASWGLLNSLVIATSREDVGRVLHGADPAAYRKFVESFATSMKPELPPVASAELVSDRENARLLDTVAKIEAAVAPRKSSTDGDERRSYERISADLSEVKGLLDGSRPDLAAKYAAFGGPEEVLASMQLALGLKAENTAGHIDATSATRDQVLDPLTDSPAQMRAKLEKSGLAQSNPEAYQQANAMVSSIEAAQQNGAAGDAKAREIETAKRLELKQGLGRVGFIMLAVTVATPYATNALRGNSSNKN